MRGQEEGERSGGPRHLACRRWILPVLAAFLLACSAAVGLIGQEGGARAEERREETLLQSPIDYLLSSRRSSFPQSPNSARSLANFPSKRLRSASQVHVLSWLLLDPNRRARRGRSKPLKDPHLSQRLLTYILGDGDEAQGGKESLAANGVRASSEITSRARPSETLTLAQRRSSSKTPVSSAPGRTELSKKFASLVENGESARAIAAAKRSIEHLYQQLNSLDVRILQQEWNKLSPQQRLAARHNHTSSHPGGIPRPYGKNIVHLLFERGSWINETENKVQRSSLTHAVKATANMSDSSGRAAIVNPDTFSWLFGRPWRRETEIAPATAESEDGRMAEIINQTVHFNEQNTRSQAVLDAQHRVMNIFKEAPAGTISIVIRNNQTRARAPREKLVGRRMVSAKGSQLASRGGNLLKSSSSRLAARSFVPNLPGDSNACKGSDCNLSDLDIFGQWLLVALAILLTILACTVAGFICFGCLWAWREFRRQDRWDLLVDREIDKETSQSKSGKVMQPSKPSPSQGKQTSQPGRNQAGGSSFTRRSDSIMSR